MAASKIGAAIYLINSFAKKNISLRDYLKFISCFLNNNCSGNNKHYKNLQAINTIALTLTGKNLFLSSETAYKFLS